MAKQATKRPAQPAGRPAARGGTSGAVSPSRAQQAARHQGRDDPDPAPPRRDAAPAQSRQAPPAEPKRNLPAAQDFGSSASVPAFMRNDAGMGKENIGREDLETPRLKLMQGLSKELGAYNELRAGMFFHSAAEFVFDESFLAVPIHMDRQYILWRPRDSGGGIIARASDGVHWSPDRGDIKVKLDKKDGGSEVMWRLGKTVQQSGLANWGTMNPEDPNSPPAATLMYNFVLAFPEHPDLMPAVLTFQRSSIKMGRRFNTKLKTTRVPLFGLQYRFSSFTDHNGAGQEFHNVNVTGEGLVEDERLYGQYKEMHLSFKEAGLQIKDIEGLQDEDPAGDPADEGDGGQQQGHRRF